MLHEREERRRKSFLFFLSGAAENSTSDAFICLNLFHFRGSKKILCVVYIHKAFSRQFFFIKESGKKHSKTEPCQPVYSVTACFPFFFLFASTHAAADRQGHTAMGLSLSSFSFRPRKGRQA
jgi:hypothetical protein